MQWVTRLHRIEHAGIPVYIDQEKPDWFVPSTRTDDLLRSCQKHGNWSTVLSESCERHQETPDQVCRDLGRLERLLDRERSASYQGADGDCVPGRGQ
ncbi:MAG: hypothetical protein D3908_09685, partial [Candidatus Electrothrix sp. AUS4]|nr:hypothetical protein [Candidatus Electrothrix sp. AUS4]